MTGKITYKMTQRKIDRNTSGYTIIKKDIYRMCRTAKEAVVPTKSKEIEDI